MENYIKPPLTYTNQVALLQSRGMLIPDVKRAERLLANISYYRLSAYMLPYKKKGKRLNHRLFQGKYDMEYDL